MTEDSERESPEQLPRFQGRKYDQEHMEGSKKRDRKRNWLLNSVSVIIDMIASWP